MTKSCRTANSIAAEINRLESVIAEGYLTQRQFSRTVKVLLTDKRRALIEGKIKSLKAMQPQLIWISKYLIPGAPKPATKVGRFPKGRALRMGL